MKYLWIDGICIQQCSMATKTQKFADMHHIYGMAQFTIVGAQSKSANEGLKGVRPDLRPEFAGHLAHEIDKDTALVTSLPLPKDFKTSIWSTRGWCLQEQLLSKHFLVFWDNQVYWQCSKALLFEDMASELKPEDLPSETKLYRIEPAEPEVDKPSFLVPVDQISVDLSKLSATASQSGDLSTKLLLDGSTVVTTVFKEYISLVMLYSQRTLTFETDALNAVRGLLSILEAGLDTQMLYGLPESLLDAALLWKARKPLRRRCQHIIPSWSWAGWTEVNSTVDRCPEIAEWTSSERIDSPSPEQQSISRGVISYDPAIQFNAKNRQLLEVSHDEEHLERVRPFVTWFKSSDNGRVELLNGTGMGIKYNDTSRTALWGQAETLPDYGATQESIS